MKHGLHTRSARVSVNMEHKQMILTREEEKQLVDWLQKQNEQNMPPSRKELYFRIKEVMKTRDPPDELKKKPTATWYKAFQDRHNLSGNLGQLRLPE